MKGLIQSRLTKAGLVSAAFLVATPLYAQMSPAAPAEPAAPSATPAPAAGAGNFTDAETISSDETAIFFGAPPLRQMMPDDAERAAAPESNDKARFTAFYIPKKAEVSHGGLVLKDDVVGVSGEICTHHNPQFERMMRAVATFAAEEAGDG